MPYADDSFPVRLLLCVDSANSRLQVIVDNDDVIRQWAAGSSSLGLFRLAENLRAWLPSSRRRKLVLDLYKSMPQKQFPFSRKSTTTQARRTGSGYLPWLSRQPRWLSSGVYLTILSKGMRLEKMRSTRERLSEDFL